MERYDADEVRRNTVFATPFPQHRLRNNPSIKKRPTQDEPCAGRWSHSLALWKSALAAGRTSFMISTY